MAAVLRLQAAYRPCRAAAYQHIRRLQVTGAAFPRLPRRSFGQVTTEHVSSSEHDTYNQPGQAPFVKASLAILQQINRVSQNPSLRKHLSDTQTYSWNSFLPRAVAQLNDIQDDASLDQLKIAGMFSTMLTMNASDAPD